MSVTMFNRGDRLRSYTFTAPDLPAAEQCMFRLGPRDADGRHAAMCHIGADIRSGLGIEIVPGSTTKSGNPEVWVSSARISQATLHVWADIEFPSWTNVTSLSRPVQAEWRRFTNCLERHERGHWQSVRPILNRYRAEFDRLQIRGEGATQQAAEANARQQLNQNIDDLFGSMTLEVQDDIVEYDYVQDHGRRQGARLRTTIR